MRYRVGEGFRERGEALRGVDYEGWVGAFGFDVGAAQFVEKTGEGWVLGDGESEVVEEMCYLG